MEPYIAALMEFVTILLSKTACSTIRSISICMHKHIIRTKRSSNSDSIPKSFIGQVLDTDIRLCSSLLMCWAADILPLLDKLY